MKKEKWSDYAKYLILSDRSNNRIGTTFESFLNFKKVKEVINNIAFTIVVSILDAIGNVHIA